MANVPFLSHIHLEKNLILHVCTAIEELAADAIFECIEEGINFQAMDRFNSNVAVVAVKLDTIGEYALIVISCYLFVFLLPLAPSMFPL